MSVDMERRHDLPINIDISFQAVPCAVLSIDVLDISGTAENDASFAKGMEIHKIRLDANGKKVGKAEYVTPQSQQIVEDGQGGAMMNVNVPMAMKHLTEMEEEADRHEGCHLSGTMLVHRVAGRVHISVHQQVVFQVLPQLLNGHHIPKVLNMSHTIHHLSFGPYFPGQVNPLTGYTRLLRDAPAQFKYFLKVVPTQYFGRLGGVTETHQYSVTEYAAPIPADGSKAPALDFMYDLSPIVVTLNERPPSVLHYLVRMSAVVGGVFAITRLIDRNVHWLFVRMKWYHGA
eukprot:CAMPEP_0202861090 /NCGR_PEP_ID=MMETSP1391-20130828/2603_1 /ASSEMBLY_ACC=CAM_ASM_000867 /TAXON_ID=1034604 /ORGANISM="Chlamydomonas leiostraca, Strain SAG 11-49" /LENGTH=287 /DNA_ID=CAMNT_0049540413 /DNA_START=178 /DNA_END=1041 /DNA_ORIENTATION=+